MPKNKRKHNNKAIQENRQFAAGSINIVTTDSMSADEIQQIITNAILAADEAKKQNEREQKERECCELRDIIGYKEYEDKNGIIRYVLLFFNRTSMIVKLLFAPKRVIKGDETTFGLLKMFVEMILRMTEYITMMFSFVSAIYIPLQYVVEVIPTLSIFQNIVLGLFVLATFLLSRMVHMAAIEIYNIEDRNLLFGIFASLTSIVSIVISAIAIVK